MITIDQHDELIHKCFKHLCPCELEDEECKREFDWCHKRMLNVQKIMELMEIGIEMEEIIRFAQTSDQLPIFVEE